MNQGRRVPNELAGIVVGGVAAVCLLPLVACGDSGKRGTPAPPYSPATARSVAGDCSKCSLELRHLATLGDLDGDGALTGKAQSVALAGKAGVIVVEGPDSPRMLLYDRAGKFLRRIGRSGEGPGELDNVGAPFFIAPDTIAVRTRNRITMHFDTTGRHLRSEEPALPPGSIYWLSRNTQVLHETRSESGAPGRLLFLEGRSRVRFATVLASHFPSPDSTMKWLPAVISTNESTFWAARLGDATLVEMDSLGKRVSLISRRPEWFSYLDESLPYGERPPISRIVNAARLEEGLLLVLAVAPHPNWRKAYERGAPLAPGKSEYSARDIPWTILSETMLELIDEKTQKMLTGLRLVEVPLALLPGNLLATYVEDSYDIPRVVLYSVTLRRR